MSRFRDPLATLAAANQAGIAVIAVTEDPDEYRRLRTRLGRRSTVDVALGLHPARAASFGSNQLARFFRLVPQAEWIGEVGLDYSREGMGSARAQQRIFEAVLTEAQPGRHPLTVHSRGAEKEVIDCLSQAALPAVLHWYSGPLRLVDNALEAGLYFSVNAAMTRSRKFMSLTQAIPSDRVLLETDGPYAKDRGHPAEPSHLKSVVARLAEAWEIGLAEATQIVLSNQLRFRGSVSGGPGTPGRLSVNVDDPKRA